MKITTIVMASALAISSSCAFAAGGAGSAAAGGAAGTAGGSSAGARGGVSPGVAFPGVAAPGGISSTTPGTTTGMGTGTSTGVPATPGLNAKWALQWCVVNDGWRRLLIAFADAEKRDNPMRRVSGVTPARPPHHFGAHGSRHAGPETGSG